MPRLIHLSDLHFGRDRPELAPQLLAAVTRLAPDLALVSGDLTQRARPGQFRAARAFLDRLPCPWLAVPGNHDTPLDNMAMRVLLPWRRYRRHIGAELAPGAALPGVTIVSANTATPLRWQGGRIWPWTVARLVRALSAAPEGAIRVLMVHHPFHQPPGTGKAPMQGAKPALDRLARAGVDLVVSGHLHSWSAAPFVTRDREHGLIELGAGTGLSDRLRGQENDFNQIDLGPDRIGITRHVADGDGFSAVESRLYRRAGRGWLRDDPA